MRREEIEDLIRLVEESKITELEVWEGKRRIRIAKGHPVAVNRPEAPIEAPAQPFSAGSASRSEGNSREAAELASNLKEILSPMVGTFYRAPAPDADPFVDVGEEVRTGQTVCIVEAMKLMNEIGADTNGVIRSVLVDNGQPVEFGQPLFQVEPK